MRPILITLLSKADKYITKTGNYKSISLMNTDIRNTISLMNTDIRYYNIRKPNTTRKRIICHNCMRFIPGIQDWFNIQKSK